MTDYFPQIPWPKKGDELFGISHDWTDNASLNYLADSIEAYASGYKKAGDILAQYALSDRTSADLLIYPLAFLYRQNIELKLKEIIYKGNSLLDIPPKPPRGHDLDKLWRKARAIIEEVWPEGSVADLDNVQESIREFSSIDPASTSFRYPVDRDDNPSLPEVSHINIRNFSEVIDRLVNLLNGVAWGIADMLDSQPRDHEYDQWQ